MIKKILNSQIYKVLSYNGVVVLSKILSSFVVSKVTAIYLGPSGLAILGNFRNVLQGVLGLTSNGFQSGVIKYVAQHNKNKEAKKRVVTNALIFNILICLFFSPFLFFLSDKLAVYILKNISYSYIFQYLSFLLPLISLWFVMLYIVNGLQEFKLYTKLQVIANLLNAILIFLFVYLFQLKGALIASILIYTLSFLFSLAFKNIRNLFFSALIDFKNISLSFFKSISVYIIMAIYSALLISLSYLLIRNSIIKNVDLITAGLWEAMNKVSMFYMMFFSSIYTMYLLPKLSENKTVNGYYAIMREYFSLLLPITIFGFLIIYLIKFFIIKLFLTEEFLIISQFFHLQLIGDFFKVIAFSLAYQFHAKKMVYCYYITDTILYGTFYLLSVYLLNAYNLKGVFFAYIFSTFLYLLIVIFLIISTRHLYLKKVDV